MSERLKNALYAIVAFANRAPWVVLGVALMIGSACWWYGSHLEAHTDFLDLVPKDTPGYRAYERQLGRVGGGASLIIIVESPDRLANERYIDDAYAKVAAIDAEHEACVKRCGEDVACKGRCGPKVISYIEHGTKDVHKFYEDNKWLYADLKDLEDADRTLDRQIAIKSGMVDDLDDDSTPAPAPAPAAGDGGAAASSDAGAAPAATTAGDAGAEAGTADKNGKKPALGMNEFKTRWRAEADKKDDFPRGYFETDDGTLAALRIITLTTGTGEGASDILHDRARQIIKDQNPAAYNPAMRVGLAGDIPNAVEEKRSIISEAVWASVLALVLILGGVVWYYKSPWSLFVITLPALMGVGSAYAFAMWRYGYVNTAGAFLGAIILGNGINYPIVLLSRYREFRARGQAPEDARKNAVWNSMRAELLGASVAAIAYGSLTITRSRGFSQFGTIGFVGMLFVWLWMIPLVPALITLIERAQARLPSWMREPLPKVREDDSQGFVTGFLARFTERFRWPILAIASIATIALAYKIPEYVKDPWEYHFDKLGSKGTRHVGGANEWSAKADKIFGRKLNIAGARVLVDHPGQAAAVRQQILDNDKKDPEGQLIVDIKTVDSLLPGDAELQKQKLEVLDRIRSRLTERVLFDMSPEERKDLEEMRPPETLTPITGQNLPDILRRRFEEIDGTIGTLMYVQFRNDIGLSNGRTVLRIAKTTDNVVLPDGTLVHTASGSTRYAELIRSMTRDAPLATMVSFGAVIIVVLIATHSARGAAAVIASLLMGVLWMVGMAAHADLRLNFLNFVALPITFGIGCEYPFNIYDRSRLLNGDVSASVKRVAGAVMLCSFTTTVGYGSLLVADNQALESFGRLAVTGEITTLLCAVLVLPALLHVMRNAFAKNKP
jgi:predicted RND superfamily exporter protein